MVCACKPGLWDRLTVLGYTGLCGEQGRKEEKKREGRRRIVIGIDQSWRVLNFA